MGTARIVFGTPIKWTLIEKNGSATVHFAHEGWAGDDGPFPSSALTWGLLMGTLKDYAENAVPTPLFHRGE